MPSSRSLATVLTRSSENGRPLLTCTTINPSLSNPRSTRVQLDECADEQRRTNDENHRDRKLGDDERLAQATVTVGTHLFQRRVDRDAERLKCRDEPRCDARRERHSCCEHDHSPVGRHGQIDWTAVEEQIEQPLADASGKRETGRATSAASTRLSVRNWRTSRPRPARSQDVSRSPADVRPHVPAATPTR